MPIGPNGEKRPSNPNAAAIMVARIATGRAKEEYVGDVKAEENVPKFEMKRSAKSEEEKR